MSETRRNYRVYSLLLPLPSHRNLVWKFLPRVDRTSLGRLSHEAKQLPVTLNPYDVIVKRSGCLALPGEKPTHVVTTGSEPRTTEENDALPSAETPALRRHRDVLGY